MKPKEYLVSIGALDEIKRGRLSLAHIELCKDAAGKGISIEGYSVSKSNDTSTGPVVTKEKVTNEKVIAEIPESSEYRYPFDEFVAYELVDGKRKTRSLKEACRQTGVSVVNCPCNNHLIVATDGTGSVPVFIERK